MILLFVFIFSFDSFFAKYGIPFGFLGPLIAALFVCFELKTSVLKNHILINCGKFFGNLTYSTYLMHVPVQLMFILVDIHITKLNFFSGSTLIAYITSVMLISIMSFLYFEKPMRKYINSILN